MPHVLSKTRLEVRNRPDETPVMHQDWRHLLFLHWKYDADLLQKTLPPGLYVDIFEGNGYITITPLLMENIKLANLPSIPGLSNFVEVNFRTYVYDGNGVPGVWFYSLDVNSFVASNIARQTFLLPYYHTDLKESQSKNEITIQGKRMDDPQVSMKFVYRIPSNEKSHAAEEGSLDFFLIERYALFTFAINQLNVCKVHHQPYAINRLKNVECQNHLWKANGFPPMAEPPALVHYSSGVDVDIFSLKKDKVPQGLS